LNRNIEDRNDVCFISNPLLLGFEVENHFFSLSKANAFRKKVLILLMALVVIALVRAILQ